MAAADLIGQRFERLVVLERNGTSKDRKALWRCQCSCGGELTTSGKSLRLGLTRSCGCLQKERASQSSRLQLAGQTFGRLTVLAAAGTRGSGRRVLSLWRCHCSCGKELTVSGSDLASGNTRSCGCLKRDTTSLQRSSRLEGQVFERLTVVRRAGSNRFGQALWECRCTCGSVVRVTSGSLQGGTTRSCGCLQKERASQVSRVDIAGQHFGMLHVISSAGAQAMKRGSVALWQCRCTCGNTVIVTGGNLRSGNSKSCGCVASHKEKEILQLVRSWLGDDAVLGDTPIGDSRLRFDVVCPQQRIAIEFNGVYWHSGEFKERNYHQLKRELAEAEGYRLISVWEDDWRSQQGKIQALLRRALALDPIRRIGARRLTLKPLDAKAAHAFHEQHHLQGRSRGNLHLGAWLGDELLAVGSFLWALGAQASNLERYTVKAGVSAPGVLRRMAARTPWQRLITHCDRDYFTGSVYRASGFKHTGYNLQLRYSDGRQRYHRQNFQKHKLPALGIIINDGETANQALARCSIHPCWNSGVERYELELP